MLVFHRRRILFTFLIAFSFKVYYNFFRKRILSFYKLYPLLIIYTPLIESQRFPLALFPTIIYNFLSLCNCKADICNPLHCLLLLLQIIIVKICLHLFRQHSAALLIFVIYIIDMTQFSSFKYFKFFKHILIHRIHCKLRTN